MIWQLLADVKLAVKSPEAVARVDWTTPLCCVWQAWSLLTVGLPRSPFEPYKTATKASRGSRASPTSGGHDARREGDKETVPNSNKAGGPDPRQPDQNHKQKGRCGEGGNFNSVRSFSSEASHGTGTRLFTMAGRALVL